MPQTTAPLLQPSRLKDPDASHQTIGPQGSDCTQNADCQPYGCFLHALPQNHLHDEVAIGANGCSNTNFTEPLRDIVGQHSKNTNHENNLHVGCPHKI